MTFLDILIDAAIVGVPLTALWAFIQFPNSGFATKLRGLWSN